VAGRSASVKEDAGDRLDCSVVPGKSILVGLASLSDLGAATQGAGLLILGDCLDVMPTLPAASVDLILCDLPYGTTQNKWDSIIPLDRLWTEYWRIAKSNAAIVLTAQAPFDKALGASCLQHLKYEWIWSKKLATGHLNAKKQPMKAHENALVFYRSQSTYIPQMTVGKPYTAKSGRQSSNYGDQVEVVTENSGERYPRSVIEFDHDRGLRVHPTQKPVALMEYLIRTYTNEGDIVLDNCMGSGTTGVACNNTGRKFIGIERDPAYFEIARLRVEPMPWEINVPS
jgi:site-specific DNA-methyltransferase (adenine-specific)